MGTVTTFSLTMIKVLAAILAGVLMGNGIVYVFNRIPASWLTEYGETPSEELLDSYAQRLKGYPARYLYSMLFVCAAVWLVVRDVRSAIPVLAALWILTEIAIGDAKYRIIPDQWVVLLAVCGLGLIGRSFGWKDALCGLLAGSAVIGAVALVGHLAYRKMAVGAGDVKLFAALGMLTGLQGILLVFVLATLLSGVHYIYLLASKRMRKGEALAYAPYVTIACWIYWLFLWDRMTLLSALFRL